MLGKFVEQAEKDDPERLRERIAALEGELKAARKTPVAAPAPKIDKAAILRNAKQIQEAVEKMHATDASGALTRWGGGGR